MSAKRAIAKLNLVGVPRTGKRRRIAISIETPYAIRDARGGDCAACPISIRGLGRHPRLNAHRILGEDTFQALSIALAFIRRRLLDFVESGNRLLFADGKSQLPLKAYFPQYDREPNSGAAPVRGRSIGRGNAAGMRRGRGRRARASGGR
jgi:hypothetical protein